MLSDLKLRVAGISFEHMHMGDNLRMAQDHPQCEIVAICDSQLERMHSATLDLGLWSHQVFTDWQRCVAETKPDLIILCPSTGDHALWVERLAPLGIPLLLEKPMAASLEDADRIIAACARSKVKLAINWPMVWVPSHRTAKRLVDEGRIGNLIEVHYYDGNRGPLWHTAGKLELTAEDVAREKPSSWFYSPEQGGGSLLDYLGYGVTLGSWFLQGRVPLEVTCVCDEPQGLEVDEHSITIARYEFGVSKFETRWGTFTDPWVHQPQPKCGFVLVGTEGTISSYDYEPTVRVQDRANPAGVSVPADQVDAPNQNPVQYMVHCLQHDLPIEGPLSLEMSRLGQRIVDTAFQSARLKRTLSLLD
jgi:predicted dehydrogenase